MESINIQCLAKIERENVLWREFSSKQILRKMAVLNSVFNKNFTENGFLLCIYDEKVIDNEKIQTALDLIRDKYGVDIIKPASFIEHDKENV